MALLDAWLHDGKTYDGKEGRLLVASLSAGRGGVALPGDLKISQSGTPDNKISMAAGSALVPASSAGVLGSWEVPNDAALASANLGSTGAQGRWDLVLLQVVTGVPQITLVTGTPAGSPAEPSLAAYNDYIRLARVEIPPSTTNITNAMIVDQRTMWSDYVVCTSTTRPASPYEGQRIYETDTDKALMWNGVSWSQPWNQPWGILGKALVTAQQSGIVGAQVDITDLAVTINAVANRQLEISVHFAAQSTVSNDIARLDICDASNTLLQNGQVVLQSVPLTYPGFLLLHTPAAGSRTYKARFGRTAGSGSINTCCNSGAPLILEVKDIGPNGVPA